MNVSCFIVRFEVCHHSYHTSMPTSTLCLGQAFVLELRAEIYVARRV